MQYVLRVHARKNKEGKKIERRERESQLDLGIFPRFIYLYHFATRQKGTFAWKFFPTFPLKGRRVQIHHSISRQEKD